MYDIVIAFPIIVFLITILGCIPYGIWVIYSMVKKKWKLVGYQILILIFVYASLVGVYALLNNKLESDYLVGLYDCNAELGSSIFEYDSDRSFNGDGYSFTVYELPTNIRKRFESPDERLLTKYPKRPSYRDHWKFEHWREAPFDDKFEEYLDFALCWYDADESSELTKHFEDASFGTATQGHILRVFLQ